MAKKQAIGIPMGTDPASFWAYLFLYSYEEESISLLVSSDKIKVRHFHSTKRFTDDLCTINDGGEFRRSVFDIYLKELERQDGHAML